MDVIDNDRVGPSQMRIAADLRWADPNRSWDSIAKEIGIGVATLYRWRQTEEWTQAWIAAGREIDKEYMLPLANEAWKAAWRKGNPAGVLELKRAWGILSNEQIEINHTMTAAEVIELQRRLEQPAAE